MIKINLLPHERRQGMRGPAMARSVIIGVGALVIIAVLGYAIYENQQFIEKDSKIIELQTKIEELDKKLEPVLELERRQDMLNRKKKVIDRLILQRLKWASKLNLLAELVPERIWLENLEIITEKVKLERREKAPGTTASGKPRYRTKKYTVLRKRLVIEGVTDDLTNKTALVGQFIKNIENNEEFIEAFSSIGRVEAQEENWVPRDEASPLVWRFKFSMEIKDRGKADDKDDSSKA